MVGAGVTQYDRLIVQKCSLGLPMRAMVVFTVVATGYYSDDNNHWPGSEHAVSVQPREQHCVS